ncbi:DUF1611 domain-containing protein [Eubacterium sp. AF36-5BH]|uniref:S8 family serine peptidase n=1 Tax=Eubacterium sp. AF36-5BH TaxID=2293108 RepID=UPI000E49215F|nr:S8 family serine peptidase [Eubacterium sp. AF36-5BH]RGF50593.1 DUF1611 domain-containing protein [Eubacterium sp. AF36-5BH]
MVIGIIDSGINKEALGNWNVKQYRVYQGKVYEEKATDYYGHGTVVFDVIRKCIQSKEKHEIISLCPGINKKGRIEQSIDSTDIAKAIELAMENGCNVINISMGTFNIYNHRKLYDVCKNAKKRNVKIFCARSNGYEPAIPWASGDVYKVREKDSNTQIEIINENGIQEIVTPAYTNYYHKGENTELISGNSFACARITGLFCNELINGGNEIRNIITKYNGAEVKIIDEKFQFRKKRIRMNKVVLVSFSKEMHGLILEKNNLQYDIVGIVDSAKKGTINRDVGDLLKIEKTGLRITNRLDKITFDYDTLIIGYLKEISRVDEYFLMENILRENLKNRKANVYSFLPIPKEWQKIYEKEGIKFETSPVVDKRELKRIERAIPCDFKSTKPVIGVFGTTSQIGKFTMQLRMKEIFEKRKIKVFHLSTEHQAYLLGADVVLPDGYDSIENANISYNDKMKFLRKAITYSEINSDCDMVLEGTQAGILPSELYMWDFMFNGSFLDATKPDLGVLAVNPLGNKEIIRDTIDVLRAGFRCKTIALTFPDKLYKKNKYGISVKSKISFEEQVEIARKMSEEFGVMSGCIMDDEFVKEVVDEIITICS